jgi:hypothetical protein
MGLPQGRRIHVDSGNIQRHVNAVNIGWTRGRRNRSVVLPEGGTAMSRITRSHPRRSLVAAGIIGLVGLAASTATYAENLCAERGRLIVAVPEHLELGFSLHFDGVGAEGIDDIWRGQLAGPTGGEVVIRLALLAPTSESARPSWPVHAIVFVAADDAARSFVAELDGTVDWKSGAMRLSGLVTFGWMAGSPIGETAQIDPAQLDGDGTLRIGILGVASSIVEEP